MERIQTEVPNPLILEKGIWRPEDVIVQQIIDKRNLIKIHKIDQIAIENNWQDILKKNPDAFVGPTIRLVNNHIVGKKLILEVLPSDYKEGCFLNFLGAAMIPITSDGFVILQAKTAAIAAIMGEGIRMPGCTFQHIRIFEHIIQEMNEEFNVDITKDQLIVFGLLRTNPPITKFHYTLVVEVSLRETMEELMEKWLNAKDKWEGDPLPLNLSLKKEIENLIPQMSPICRICVKLIIEKRPE